MNLILSSVKKGFDFAFVFDGFLPLSSLSFFISVQLFFQPQSEKTPKGNNFENDIRRGEKLSHRVPHTPRRSEAYHLINKLINVVFGDPLEFLFPFKCFIGNIFPVNILGLEMKLGTAYEKEKTH
jgi:hypothetical protein